jgi:hypothetical protein
MAHGDLNPLPMVTVILSKPFIIIIIVVAIIITTFYAHSTAYYIKVKCTQLGLAGVVCWLWFKAPTNATG